MQNGFRLLTLDNRLYRAVFPRLTILSHLIFERDTRSGSLSGLVRPYRACGIGYSTATITTM